LEEFSKLDFHEKIFQEYLTERKLYIVKSVQFLEFVFPFDPLMLSRSEKFLNPIYSSRDKQRNSLANQKRIFYSTTQSEFSELGKSPIDE
jgi:hypothetical protein